MIRLLAIAALLALACRVVFGRWPWDYLHARPSRAEALHRARRLLGVADGAGEADIRAAHRRKIAALHPDRGGNTRATQDLNAARDLLLADQRSQPAEP